jgi:ubiquinone/menaquinone biosynthesis C-methylase UbiE
VSSSPIPARGQDGSARRERGFWTENQPGLRFSDQERGTPEFFAEIELHRYKLEQSIDEMADFEAWRDRDVLEVGCGIATDGIRFARARARYTGLDFSPTALSLARRRFELERRKVSLIEGTATEMPFEDGSFDLVYSNGVLHHICQADKAVAEIHRVLRPGGNAVIMVYHRDSLNYWVNIMLIRRMLAATLLLPGAPAAVAKLTGEDREVLEGHRRLLSTHGLRYLRDKQLFLSNNTDGPGNPLSVVYSRADAKRLFDDFASVRTDVRHLNLRIYPSGERLSATALARRLERYVGWHLWIRAEKPSG